MKKVAVCISGQFRTFDKIWKENLKILNKDKKYDYYFFCFFWKNKGNTHKIIKGSNRTIKTLYLDPFIYYPTKENLKVSKREIEKIIPNAKIKISEILEKDYFYKDNVLELIQNYPHNNNDAFNGFCLWKSIQICDQMRIDFQKKKRIKFNCVMRIRPDWKLKKNPIDKFFKMEKNIVFFDSTSIQTKVKSFASVTDVCFVSNVEIFNKISKLYLNWINEIKKKGWIKYDYGSKIFNYKLIAETVLYWFIKKEKIKISTVTSGGYGFIYRYNYDKRYFKKKISLKLLLKQIIEIPQKSIYNIIHKS